MEYSSSLSSCCSYLSSIAVIVILVFPNLLPGGRTKNNIKKMRKYAKNFSQDNEEETSEGGKNTTTDSSLD
jgi:hypothetical protein